MLAWLFLAVAVGLVGVLIQMWTAFRNLRRRILANQQVVKEQTVVHGAALEEARGEIDALEAEAAEAALRLEQLEDSVMAARERLAELEAKEQKLHPSRHRVDLGGEDREDREDREARS